MSIKLTSAETGRNRSSLAAAVGTSNKISLAPFTNTYIKDTPNGWSNVAVGAIDTTNTTSIAPSVQITNVYITDSNWNIIDDTAIPSTGGHLKVIGSGFKSGAVVYVQGYASPSVSFVSSTELRVTTASGLPTGTLQIYVVNPDNSVAIRISGILVSGVPDWVTTSPLPEQLMDAAFSIQLEATSDSTIAYSLQDGSSLPSGVSLTTSGLLSGTVSGLSIDTSYSFTLVATDLEYQDTAKLFTVTVSLGDLYFKYNNLLLTTNTKTWIIDSSTNSFFPTITNAKPSARTPFTESDVTGSTYFDGTSYLSYANDNAFLFGSGDYTVECWVYFNSNAASQAIANVYKLANTRSWRLALIASGLTWEELGTTIITTNFIPTISTWYHIAVSRSGSSVKFFINGNQYGATGSSLNNITGTDVLMLGATNDAVSPTWLMNGFISNFRITKGQAIYTANTTPPSTSLTADANTSILSLQSRRGENNFRFIEESNNKYALTRTGSVSQGSFTPFNPGGFSAYFGGLGNYIVSNAAAFTTTQSTFTVECWMFMTATTGLGNPPLVGDMSPTGTDNNWSFGPNSSNKLAFYWWDGAGKSAVGSTTLTLNTWYHIAVSVSANAIKLFLNGVPETLTGTTTLTNRAATTSTIALGQAQSSSYYYIGYVSNLSILSGTAKYDLQFTPPTAPLANNTTNQVFLFGNTYLFKDENTATTAKTLTATGSNLKIQTFCPYSPTAVYSPTIHGGSIYLDNGGGDYIVGPTNFFSGTTNTFTIEGWLYPTTFTFNGSQSFPFGDQQAAGGTSYLSLRINSTGTISLYWYDGAAKFATSTNKLGLNQWNYYAIVVNNNAISLYVNSGTTETLTGTTTLTNRGGTTGFALGQYNNQYWFPGYIGPTRWSNGIARSISVPTTPFDSDANTTLLLNFSNAGIYDAAGRGNLETLADVRSSNTISKFSTSATYFDGTGDYLYANISNPQNILTGDFTIESWVYPISNTNNYIITLGSETTSRYNMFLSSGVLGTNLFGAASTLYTSNNVPQSAWTHVAVCRSGSTIKGFVNGIASSNTDTNSATLGNGPLRIGSDSSGATNWNGYLQDLRISSYARYTSNTFSVPTRSFSQR